MKNIRLPRNGLTLVELIVASTIMALIVGGMAALAMTVEASGKHGGQLSTTLQHAQVVTERIERTLLSAQASNDFPGFFVFSETESGHSFPDTLIVWSPVDEAKDPTGSPTFDELVVFTPDPDNPNRLLEITARDFPTPIPPLTDLGMWSYALDTLRSSDDVERVTLTNRLHTAVTSDGADPRAAIRFIVRLSPSDEEIDEYPSTKSWSDLPWVRNLYTNDQGLRQAWCRFELQMNRDQEKASPSNADNALPFFGSAAIYYQWRK